MKNVNTSAGFRFICFMMFQGFVAALNCTRPTPESLFHALEKDLFPKYNIRPVKSFSNPMNVTIHVTLVAILGVDEKEQAVSIFMWKILEWDIEGLSWDKEDCGTDRVAVPRQNLWIPDITISEFLRADESPITPYVYLYNNGHVFDDKPLRVVSSCQLEIYLFPFDVQNCSLTFGSYLHFAEDIILTEGMTAEAILKEYRQVMYTKGEWELADINVARTVLEFEGIILRRRPILYVVNLLIPSCFLVTVDLLSFLLPPQSVDRSSFKMTLILGYTVFLLIMNDLLPVTANAIPLINVFFSLSLALMVASLLETVFVTNIQFSCSEYSAVPNWLRVLVLHYLACVVCLPPLKKTNRITVSLQQHEGINNDSAHLSAKDLQFICGDIDTVKSVEDPVVSELSRDVAVIRRQVDQHIQGTNNTKEWLMMGIIIDRLLFTLYILFITVSFITVICIWTLNSLSTH